jgi:heme/copper-type cytochrome/quinol oxidase subunit 3
MVLAQEQRGRQMTERIAGTPFAPKFMGDLAHLDSHGHSHRSLTWWGMMAMIAVEGTVFALACAAYLYLSNQSPQWPPHKLSPDLLWGTAFTTLTVLSFLPNMWMNRVAEKEELKPLQLGLIAMSVIGLALVGIRVMEFASLNVAWSDSAYGSIVVTLLGLHTAHLVTDLFDTLVLTGLMFTRHARGRRFVDCAENAIYWNFVVFAWLPIYALLYWAPREL